MRSLRKKVCLLGAFAVGKTSLIAQFVHERFSEKYQTTLGVKVDRKKFVMDETELTMLLWDLAGEDDVATVRPSYLKGLHAYIVVVDTTRAATLDVALSLHERVQNDHGELPMIMVLNKSDLSDASAIDRARVEECQSRGMRVIASSAKTGEGVEEAFRSLALDLIEEKENS